MGAAKTQCQHTCRTSESKSPNALARQNDAPAKIKPCLIRRGRRPEAMAPCRPKIAFRDCKTQAETPRTWAQAAKQQTL